MARLTEFARITGTLLIDPDGVMAQRLQASKRPRPRVASCAPRCRRLHPRRCWRCSDRPDAGAQPAIRDVFAAFAACGSAYGVVAAFAGRRFLLRAYAALGRAAALGAAHPRPGAQGLGRTLVTPGHTCSDGILTPHCRPIRHGAHHDHGTARAEWPVLIKDHHEGYII
ncbi:MAG TPA: hypothetical protein VF933_37925 [Streptosporangiaceae bacterium]